ncbi:MAG: hypothetical protein FWD33_03140 [Alphaproteobacteria bacterium]|nr:hypothetical protein [Alphaproteobacteria bacterium]
MKKYYILLLALIFAPLCADAAVIGARNAAQRPVIATPQRSAVTARAVSLGGHINTKTGGTGAPVRLTPPTGQGGGVSGPGVAALEARVDSLEAQILDFLDNHTGGSPMPADVYTISEVDGLLDGKQDVLPAGGFWGQVLMRGSGDELVWTTPDSGGDIWIHGNTILGNNLGWISAATGLTNHQVAGMLAGTSVVTTSGNYNITGILNVPTPLLPLP